MNIKQMIYNEIQAAYTKVMTNVIERGQRVPLEVFKDALAGHPHAIAAIKRSHSAPQVAPKIAEVEEEFSRIWTALFEEKSVTKSATINPDDACGSAGAALGPAVEARGYAGWAGEGPDPRDATVQSLYHQVRTDGKWAAGWYVDTTAIIDRRPATQAEIEALADKPKGKVKSAS